MARSQETFNKKEVRNKKAKKKKDKAAKKLERKESGSSSFNEMIMYVDDYGNFTTTPPDTSEKGEIDEESIQISVPKDSELGIVNDNNSSGKVTYYNAEKGYGFIRENKTGEKVFVHSTNVTGELTDKSKVTFEMERGDRGFTAVNVKII